LGYTESEIDNLFEQAVVAGPGGVAP